MPVSNKKFVIVAVATAAGLMIATGVACRILAAYLSRPTDSAPLTSEELGALPMQIGQWTGREAPLDERVVRATDTDAHVSRTYRRGRETVALYIAYGVRARDLTPHRPAVCYVGAGWTQTGRERVELALNDGTRLPCSIFKFRRGGFDQQSIIVLNYYIVDGQYSPDAALLRKKVRWGAAGIRYMAQVQVSGAAEHDVLGGSGAQALRDFAATSALEIRAVLPDASSARSAGVGHQPEQQLGAGE